MSRAVALRLRPAVLGIRKHRFRHGPLTVEQRGSQKLRRWKPIAQDTHGDMFGCSRDDEGNTARITIAKRPRSDGLVETVETVHGKRERSDLTRHCGFFDVKSGGSRATLLGDACHK